MRNIKFHYLYRDGSNYKKWADIVFLNPDNLPTGVVAKGLRKAFLENGIFIAHQVRIPEVFLAAEDQLTFDDHCFHEFASVENTSDTPNDPCRRSIREFMEEVAREAKRGWRAFDPRDRLLQRS
jgi:hypothetical protein